MQIKQIRDDASSMEILTDNYIKTICTNLPSNITEGDMVTVTPLSILKNGTMSGKII